MGQHHTSTAPGISGASGETKGLNKHLADQEAMGEWWVLGRPARGIQIQTVFSPVLLLRSWLV